MSQFIEMIAFANETHGKFWDPTYNIQCPRPLLTCCDGNGDKCPTNENCFRKKYALLGDVFAISLALVQYMNTTAPPMSDGDSFSTLRMYVYPIDTDVAGNIYGIYSHYHGKRRWLVVMPTAPDSNVLQVGTVDMDFPPSGPHPTKFYIDSKVPGSNIKYVKSLLYSRYLRGNSNFTLSLVTTIPADGTCEHVFHSETSTGPVIPVKTVLPHGDPPLDKFQFFVQAHNGLALTASTAAPYLTLTSRDFNSTSQRFFFRCVNTPVPAAPANPFTYNMYPYTQPGKVYRVTPPTDGNNGGIDILDYIEDPDVELAVLPATDPSSYIGRFMIKSYAHNTRLRASGSSVTLVDVSALPSAGDYFQFVPHGHGLISRL